MVFSLVVKAAPEDVFFRLVVKAVSEDGFSLVAKAVSEDGFFFGYEGRIGRWISLWS